MQANYDKVQIDSWSALISPENSVIGAQINYKTGPAIISLVYDLKYNPASAQKWTVTSRLESSIALF